jgi:hypothetical protein
MTYKQKVQTVMANNLPQYQQKEQPPLISSHSTQQNDHDLGRWKSMSCIGISTKCGGFNDNLKDVFFLLFSLRLIS